MRRNLLSTCVAKLILLFCFVLGCASSAKPVAKSMESKPSSPTLRLASSHWPPYVGTAEDGRAALDLTSTALARAGYIADQRVVPLEAVLSGINDGTYDGSASLWKSAERERFLLYSDAFLENRMMLVRRADGELREASLEELKGKRVGIVTDYAYGPELGAAEEALFVRGVSTEENLRSLLRGELDVVVADALVVHQVEQRYPQQMREKLAVSTNALITRSLHFAVRKDLPNAARIISEFNRQLSRMLRDGAYHQALHVHWLRADVDGDGKLELVTTDDELGASAPTSSFLPLSVSEEGESSEGARFVVKGVAYDSWQAVPDEYKRGSSGDEMGDKPATLRASVFEF